VGGWLFNPEWRKNRLALRALGGFSTWTLRWWSFALLAF